MKYFRPLIGCLMGFICGRFFIHFAEEKNTTFILLTIAIIVLSIALSCIDWYEEWKIESKYIDEHAKVMELEGANKYEQAQK